MKAIIDDALKEWNDVKADTGWEFTSDGTEADHDIEIAVGAIASGASGAVTATTPGGFKGEVTGATITFDPNLKATDGTVLAWDEQGKDKTKNPYGSAKHELSHCIRLDHQGGIRSKTGKIKDPQGKDPVGDDNPKITDEDKNEAKKASTAAVKKDEGAGGPDKPDSHTSTPAFPSELPFATQTTNAELFIQAPAFLNDVDVELACVSRTVLPFADHTPPGVAPIIKGILINLSGQTNLPAMNSLVPCLALIPYENGRGGLIDIADPERGPVAEGDLRPFLFDPGSQQWRELNHFDPPPLFSRDTNAGVVTVQMPAYLLALYTDPQETNRTTLYIGFSGSVMPAMSSVPEGQMLVISWPPQFPGFHLQSNPDLSTTNWSNVPTKSTNNVVSVPI